MRLYTFVNMYLSDKQKGIQTAHLVHELMSNKAPTSDTFTWAKDFKTIIMLDGGYSSNLQKLHTALSQTGYDCGGFRESEEALDNALTVVGVVLPEKIYNLASYARQGVCSIEQVTTASDVSENTYKATIIKDEMLANEDLVNQLESYGVYSDMDIFLVNEINKYKLA